jgi:hypothetical protein
VKAKTFGACLSPGLITICDKFLISSLVSVSMKSSVRKAKYEL